jgi:hypothetical protein
MLMGRIPTIPCMQAMFMRLAHNRAGTQRSIYWSAEYQSSGRAGLSTSDAVLAAALAPAVAKACE